MDYVLRTTNLCKHYKNFKALNGLTMNVPKGSIYGFVGRNGAGKTTLIRMVCGIQFPTDGNFELYGVKNTDEKITDTRRKMGAVIETPSIIPYLNARKNLEMQYDIMGMPDYKGIDELLDLVGLKNTGKKLAKNFSLGMRQRLGIAVALCGNPDLLVLDEPINGLDPQGIIDMRELILKLNREKKITIIISSHILDELSKIATHYGFINDGRIVREMSAEELEQECRKCMRINVTDTTVLARVLDTMKLDYKIIDNELADIYGSPNITDLALSLWDEKCKIISVSEHDENLESFFISLVGGGSDE
ncbi:MAG TPA: ATP-binding cassette domain-containing protein [Ruminococcus sp.]|nr:ATP-binding cassette domain-containing protein [Ruminococcus sp.]MBR6985526.1 ATP-binding cassette domain-containing protein [Ruminococcus sp.]HPY85000.1 ATP-binding cassette domain-containing protein [Ruminococcus flavefaciens]HRU96103.1 ATP-binding cassette domain-containing protein [Ruminococcus sp.]